MAFPSKLSQLCTPSYIYFLISVLAIAMSAVQNIGNNKKYNLGIFSCRVPSCFAVFIFKVLYILFWTWVLNLICRGGGTAVSWFLVLIPYLIFLIMVGYLLLA